MLRPPVGTLNVAQLLRSWVPRKSVLKRAVEQLGYESRPHSLTNLFRGCYPALQLG